jgi:hypothetical protein
MSDTGWFLSEVDGTEALIEGFGEQSGRFQRSM